MDIFNLRNYEGDRSEIEKTSRMLDYYLQVMERYFQDRNLYFVKADSGPMLLRASLLQYPVYELPSDIFYNSVPNEGYAEFLFEYINLFEILTEIRDLGRQDNQDQIEPYTLYTLNNLMTSALTRINKMPENDRLSAFRDFVNTLDLDEL